MRVDPRAGCPSGDPLHLDTLRNALGDEALTRVPRPCFVHAPHACPVLVCFAAPGTCVLPSFLAAYTRRIQEHGNWRRQYVCGWLSSTVAAEPLAKHLVKLCRCQKDEDVPFQSLYEPLRLELFADTLNPERQGPWWPVRHWLFPGTNGAAIMLQATHDCPEREELEARSAQQNVALIAQILEIWQRACDQRLPNTQQAPGSQAALTVHRKIQEARALGLQRPKDLVTLVLYRLVEHDQLHRHPAIATHIQSAAQGHTELAAAFAGYNDSAWQCLMYTLPYGAQP